MSQMPHDADERTHEPSDRRIADFRRRGEIPLSKDLTGTLVLLAGAAVMALTLPRIAQSIVDLFIGVLAAPRTDASVVIDQALHTLSRAALPILAAGVVGFLIAGSLQLGWPPALKSIGFDLSKLMSVGSICELVSPKAMGRRFGGGALRMALALGVGALALVPEIRALASEPVMDARTLATRLASAIGNIAMITGGVLVVLAAFDYLRTRRIIKARMRMTPAEAKREYREQEGDPQLKAKRRRRMRELAKRRLVSAVKGADVVLVNPTHFAVAIRYRKEEGKAPKVVAKGKGPVAERIRELARESGIPIVAQPPLARALHKLVREGAEIPASLFHAVAEVLAFVYRLRRRRA
jgi:flagellar biosynthetic protein FlhB